MGKLLQYCSEATEYETKEVKTVVKCFLGKIAEALSFGNSVDLGDDFVVFSTKLRTSHLAENDPRTPKDDHYKVVFRKGRKGFRRKRHMEKGGYRQ